MCIFSKDNKCKELTVDIDQPRYDHTKFTGRVKEYFFQNNPTFAFTSDGIIDKAKELLDQFRAKKLEEPCPPEEELWAAKNLVDATFHPEYCDEKVEYPGRRSTRVLFNSLVGGGMLAYYKNIIAVAAWQTINQGLNAFVTTTNRTEDQHITDDTLYKSYGAATAVAVATAIGLSFYCRTLFDKIYWRTVPFAAVALADCVRVPFLREHELNNGVRISTLEDKPLGLSKNAAAKAVGDDVLCRIMMAAPALIIPQFWMNHLERTGTFCRYPWLNYPAHVLMVALCLTFLTPLARGAFEDKGMIWLNELEDEFTGMKNVPKRLYYERNLPDDLQ